MRDYQREAIKALFATYPMMTGIGTTAGERMRNMTGRQKLDWVADTYFAALREIKRPAPFILRAWQSEPRAGARFAAPPQGSKRAAGDIGRPRSPATSAIVVHTRAHRPSFIRRPVR